MKRKFYLLLLFWMASAGNSTDDISFQFENGSILHGDVINVIEGTGLLLRCAHKTIAPWTPTWLKEGEPEFRVVSDTLNIDSIRVKHRGTYTCAFDPSKGVYLRKSVKVNCLYPPEKPTIYGPREVNFREKFSLTCNTSAFPQASIWWTFDEREDAAIIDRGSDLTFAVQEEDIGWKGFKCWAENNMIPTVGKTVVGKQTAHKWISVHQSAYIWGLHDTYTFYLNQTLDVLCQVGGHPEPEVYWTKDGDTSFSYYGPRLFKKYVQKPFAGIYSCHVQNELVNGVKNTDMRSTRVLIKDLSVPSHCKEFCGSDGQTDPVCVSTKTTAVTLSPKKSSCGWTSSCGIVLIVIGGVGWLVAVILVIVCVFCWIKQMRKTPTEIKQPRRRRPCTQEIDTGERAVRRTLPNLPYNILERDQNVDRHYSQLEVGERTAETSIKSPYFGGYLTPMPRKAD